MDFKATIDLIIKDLNEASEIIDDLKKYPGVPILQVEFAKAKCKSAGEVIALLKNLEDIFPVKEKTVEEKPPVVHKEVTQTVVVHPEETPKMPEKSVPELKTKETKPVITPIPPKEIVKPEAKKPAEKHPEPTIAEKFAHRNDLYEETLSQKHEKDLSDKLKSKPITNLSDAIGLNDRFLFISEIFDGNKDSYSQAISRLDKAESLQDAMAIIISYTGEKPENEAVLQLLDLVRLKLPADE